ncbi:MAG: hypothetical protein EON91_04280 [Brevundimonas sp.]|uniref:hypothetical protein n=1 Tax=Brevundimonas sp. TaxID=1871086 RepID=UPI00122917B3|nr:hypothetical protein [Brevundimonas sp.]RZJ18652.1 MAG: hypothetical protein EON91_04280 [Brevundimonas sp.]
MADPKQSDEAPPAPAALEDAEIETQHALEQGLGVGARELASIGESGDQGTLERGENAEGESEDDLEVDELGRSASVLDRKF